jgi:hypothetical protein
MASDNVSPECLKFKGRQRDICMGRVLTLPECNLYRKRWGLPPITDDEWDVTQPSRGIGDTVAKITSKLGVKPCGGCKKRQTKLNKMFAFKQRRIPAPSSPLHNQTWNGPVTRNLMMHLWPVSGYGAWQWNCDQLLKRASLFNGRRIISIATGPDTDSADAVKEYLKDFTNEFYVFKNNNRLREVVTHQHMLGKLQSTNPGEVTFSCHGKCVRHKISTNNSGSTVFRWTQAMYETCLDNWQAVENALKTHAMAGSFKRYGLFRLPGNHAWHYSGTFYWFRHDEVFTRNWRTTDRRFFGTESWPGRLFSPDQAACLFMDNAGDLYRLEYFNSVVEPALQKWRQETHPCPMS